MGQFKTTRGLFTKIKDDLYSFDNAALLDESRFYHDVKYIITLLGVMWFQQAEEIIEVSNYRAELPSDFSQLESAFKCNASIETDSGTPDGIVFKKLTFDHYPELRNPNTHYYDGCPDYYNQPTRCIFNAHEEILVQRNNLTTRYSKPVLLKIGNVDTRNCCTSNCMNIYSTAQDTISIQNGRVYTNFETGSIYMTYNAFPTEQETGLPLIPDNPIIEKAIEDYIKYNIVKYMRTNGDADVAQLISLFREDHKESLRQAIHETKLPSFASLINMIRLNRRSLDIYQM